MPFYSKMVAFLSDKRLSYAATPLPDTTTAGNSEVTGGSNSYLLGYVRNSIHESHYSILRYREEVIVDRAGDTEKQDAGYCNPQSHALGAARLEVCDLALVLTDEHRLNNEQIVIE